MSYSAEVDAILAELRKCGSVEEVNHVAIKYGARVQEFKESPTMHVRATHIKNAAAYRRLMIKKDEEDGQND